MTSITGMKKVLSALKKLEKQSMALDDSSVEVGYFGVNYALYVHENKTANHPVGEAKFLEGPARTHRKELGRVALEMYDRTGDLGKSLYAAGLRLQRESQKLVPVETGNLKGSADTVLKRGGGK